MFPPPAAEPTPPLIDTSCSPEIFASAVSGLSLMNGVVALTLESARCDHAKEPAPMERFVVGRVVTPIASVQALIVGLHQLLDQHGLSPFAAARETCQ